MNHSSHPATAIVLITHAGPAAGYGKEKICAV
jgi:hypothetical protein